MATGSLLDNWRPFFRHGASTMHNMADETRGAAEDLGQLPLRAEILANG